MSTVPSIEKTTRRRAPKKVVATRAARPSAPSLGGEEPLDPNVLAAAELLFEKLKRASYERELTPAERKALDDAEDTLDRADALATMNEPDGASAEEVLARYGL